jgi:hypothetical protein
LATPTAPADSYSNTSPSIGDFTSILLQMYVEILEKSSMAQVLDLGPVCEENITYFARRVKRFHVCDMFLRLNRNKREGLPSKMVWKHLDYRPHSFDGINLWDFIDHLNDDEIGRLVNLCHAMLKPRGMIIITSFEEQSAPSPINSFVIQDSYRLTFRLQNHLDLPWYYRSNRALTHMLSSFPSVKSFLYRNGIREFLCRRD